MDLGPFRCGCVLRDAERAYKSQMKIALGIWKKMLVTAPPRFASKCKTHKVGKEAESIIWWLGSQPHINNAGCEGGLKLQEAFSTKPLNRAK